MSFELVRKYRNLIAVFVASQEQAPSKNDVLRYLLSSLTGLRGIPGLAFFRGVTRRHVEYARTLLEQLDAPNFDLLAPLNTYSSENQLDKNSDFFGMLLAFFFYYGSMYSDFSQYEDLKMKVIIPLHVYREETNKKVVDSYLSEVEIARYVEGPELLPMLDSIPITENRKDEVVRRLVQILRGVVPESGALKFRHVCSVLIRIQIPDELQKDVARELINSARLTVSPELLERSATIGSLQENSLSTLAHLDFSTEEMRENFFEPILEYATESLSLENKVLAWRLVERMGGVDTARITQYIEYQLEKISESKDDFPYDGSEEAERDAAKACIHLLFAGFYTKKLPVDKQVDIINLLLSRTKRSPIEQASDFGTARGELRRNALTTLGYIKIPSICIEDVVGQLIQECRDEQYSAEQALMTLRRIKIPEERIPEAIQVILNLIDSNSNCSGSAVIFLRNVPVPEDMIDEVIDTLLRHINSVHPHIAGEMSETLGDLPIPTHRIAEVRDVISKVAALGDDDYFEGLGKRGACIALAKIDRVAFQQVLHNITQEIPLYSWFDDQLDKLDLMPPERDMVTRNIFSNLINARAGSLLRRKLSLLVRLQDSSPPEVIIACRLQLERMLTQISVEQALAFRDAIVQLDNIISRRALLVQQHIPEDVAAKIVSLAG
jgi:hypothetical protein